MQYEYFQQQLLLHNVSINGPRFLLTYLTVDRKLSFSALFALIFCSVYSPTCWVIRNAAAQQSEIIVRTLVTAASSSRSADEFRSAAPPLSLLAYFKTSVFKTAIVNNFVWDVSWHKCQVEFNSNLNFNLYVILYCHADVIQITRPGLFCFFFFYENLFYMFNLKGQ